MSGLHSDKFQRETFTFHVGSENGVKIFNCEEIQWKTESSFRWKKKDSEKEKFPINKWIKCEKVYKIFGNSGKVLADECSTIEIMKIICIDWKWLFNER